MDTTRRLRTIDGRSLLLSDGEYDYLSALFDQPRERVYDLQHAFGEAVKALSRSRGVWQRGAHEQRAIGWCRKIIDQATANRLTSADASPGEHVCAAFSVLREEIETRKTTAEGHQEEIHVDLTTHSFLPRGPQTRYLARMVRDIAPAANDLHVMAVHGSICDATYHPHFSDLDLFVVLADRAFESGSRLIRNLDVLQRASWSFYQIDPLAHHEYGRLFAECELDLYPEYYLPSETIASSSRLIGSSTMRLRSYTEQRMTALFLFSFMSRIRRADRTFAAGAFIRKALVSDLCLLPALYYQLAGTSLTKRAAIDRMRSEHDHPIFLESATAMRNNWRLLHWNRWMPNLKGRRSIVLARRLGVKAEEVLFRGPSAEEVLAACGAADGFISELVERQVLAHTSHSSVVS